MLKLDAPHLKLNSKYVKLAATRPLFGGSAENAEPENAGPMMSSLRDQKFSTGKCGTKNVGPENAGLENAGPGIQIMSSTSI